jgi:hypothetical protein
VRRFIYDYNGNERTREIEDDPTGEKETPDIGTIITRSGREWKVVSISAPQDPLGTAPIVRVFLRDMRKSSSSVKHLPK